MKKIHDQLNETAGWYRAWHSHQGHTVAHWSALVAVGVILTSHLLSGVGAYYGDQLAAVGSDSQYVQSIHSINNQFIAAVKSYAKTTNESRAQVRASLIELAKERKSLIEGALDKDPKGIAKNLFSDEFKANIPDDLDEYLEKSVEKSGKIEMLYIDNENPALSRLETQFVDDEDSTRYKLVWNSDSADIKPNSRVKVKGKQVGSTIVLEDSGTGSVQVTSGGSVSSDAAVTKRVLAILANFTDNTSQPYTQESVYNRLFNSTNSLINYYNETSYGQFAVSGDVTPWFTINDTMAPCSTTGDLPNWISLAKQKASTAGYNLSSYNYFMVFIPSNGNCGSAGYGYISSSDSLINGYGNEGTPIHEFGHNLGEYHAGQITCGSKQIDIAANCTLDAYYDPTDVMGWGATIRNFNAYHRIHKGWVTSSEVSTVSQNGTYTINSLSSTGSGVKVLKIAKPDTAENYYVSYKQPSGFDSALPNGITKGVTVHAQGKNETGSNLGYITKLLHLYPGSGASEAALADGGVFNDTVNNIKITQLSHTATEAQVMVEVNSTTPVPCSTANPTVTVAPASQSARAGTALTYTVSVKSNDSSSCPTSNFNLSHSLPTNWIGNFSVSSVSLAPGATGSSNLTVTSPASQTDGSFVLSVQTTNNTDTSKTGSGLATYVVYTPVIDTTAPTVSITSPYSGAKVSGNITITATASDNVRVSKVEFYVDGKIITTDTSTPYSARWNVNSKSVAAGVHAISARAFDTSGNMSASSTVMVTK